MLDGRKVSLGMLALTAIAGLLVSSSPCLVFGQALALALAFLVPGYVMLHLSYRDVDWWEALVLSLALSPVAFALPLYWLVAFARLSLEAASLVVTALMLLGLLFTSWRRPLTIRLFKPTPEALLIAGFWAFWLSPAWAAIARSTRLQISHHGTMHASIIYQILHGQVPPQNPMLAGSPVNLYWIYHLYLAAGVRWLCLSPVQLQAVVNGVALIASLGICALILRKWGLLGRLGVVAPLLLFGNNLGGTFHLIIRALGFTRTSVTIQDIARFPQPWLGPLDMLKDARLANLLHKFFNFTAYPLAIMYIVLLIYASLDLIRGRSKAPAFPVTLAMAGMTSFHLTSGIFAGGLGLASLALLALAMRWREGGLPFRSWARYCSAFVLGLLVLAPYLLITTTAVTEAMPGAKVQIIITQRSIKALFFSLYPLAIPFLVGAVSSIRQRDLSLMWLSCLAVASCLAALVVQLPFFHTYKLVYLTGLFGTGVAVQGLDRILIAIRSPQLRQLVTMGLLVVLCANLLLVELIYVLSGWAHDATFYSQGTAINIRKPEGDAGLGKLYIWIREHTEPEAVFLELPQSKDLMFLSLVAQRQVYVAKGRLHTEGLPEYWHRMAQAEVLFDPDSSLGAKEEVLKEVSSSVSGPLFVVLTWAQVGSRYSTLLQQFEALSCLEKVYEQPDASVFRLRY